MVTTYFLNCIMGNVFKTKTSPALPTSFYIGLSSTQPTANGSGVTEPSGAGYARVKLTNLGSPNNGKIINTANVSFNESTAGWGNMKYFVIYDSLTGGNLLMYDTLSPARTVEISTIVTVKSGTLALTLSNE